MNQWELKDTCDRRQARENASDQVAIGQFGFASDWLRRWREIFKPIIEQNQRNSGYCLDSWVDENC